MTALINASTSSGVVVTSDTSGSLAFQSNGTSIATISSTGLTMNSGNIVVASTAAPAFLAYVTTGTPSANTWTKVSCGTKVFDTASAYDATTNYRFQPTVAGYYQLNGSIGGNSSATRVTSAFYKNGSGYIYGSDSASTSSVGQVMISAIIYLNGSTDYVELWGILGTSQPWSQYAGTTIFSMFNGCLIRSA